MEDTRINETKALVGKFFEEMKSNSVTEFLMWLDCKIQYSETMEKERRAQKDMRP